MAVVLRFKRGTAAPTAGSFQIGEPAWDATNSKFYIKNTAGSMVLINPGSEDYGLITGTVDSQTDYGSIA
jgi:hypothetical protein